jgi:hypothetical protein
MELSIALPIQLFIIIIISSFATYRISKLITSDIIFENIRNSFIVWISMKKDGGWHQGWRSKVAYLIGCELCVGIWVSLFITLALQLVYGFNNLLLFMLCWMSISGIQSFCINIKG